MAEQATMSRTTNVADLLERILDKGIVIVGDIKVNLVEVELLTIKVRLLIASVDKAKSLGINWWEDDPFISAPKQNLDAPKQSSGTSKQSSGTSKQSSGTSKQKPDAPKQSPDTSKQKPDAPKQKP
jgi:hypothetical protein